jgi:methyl-accepting chemotaxis protein
MFSRVVAMFMFRAPVRQQDGQVTGQVKRLVSLSMNFSVSIAQGAEVMRFMRDADDHSRSIAAAAEQLAASVEVISSRSEDAARQAGQVCTLADSSAAEANAAVAVMEGATDAVGQAVDRLKTFAGSSKEIGAVVQQIDGIAHRTALLALNAAIEAARAGEHGRAFSVVAGEVQALAEQTMRATEDIRHRISSVLDGLNSVVEAIGAAAAQVGDGKAQVQRSSSLMLETAEGIRGVSAHVAEIAGTVTQQSSAAQNISAEIVAVHAAAEGNTAAVGQMLKAMQSASGLVAEGLAALTGGQPAQWSLYLAKSDHLLWRQHLAEMLVGSRPLPSGEVVDHHGCRFGRWYDAVTDETLRRHPNFAAIIEPHRAVHAAARDAVGCLREKRLDGALEHMGRLATASDEVVRLLDGLIDLVEANEAAESPSRGRMMLNWATS